MFVGMLWVGAAVSESGVRRSSSRLPASTPVPLKKLRHGGPAPRSDPEPFEKQSDPAGQYYAFHPTVRTV